MIVVDASVFNKLFLDEPDSPQAKAFLRHALTEALPIGAPTVLKLEACQSALHYGLAFKGPLDLLDKLTEGGFRWIEPDRSHWAKAEQIARDAEAGRPTLIDSLYHAVAVVENGTFLTADARHARRAARWGHATVLGAWKA